MFKMPTPPLHRSVQALAAIACALMLSPASAAQAASQPAATASASANAEAVYQRERAACLRGATSQSRATCLTEAGAAFDEARRTRLGNGEDTRELSRNAEQRCKNVAPADRDACQRMAHGEGTVSGSVEGGGVIKEVVTVTVGPAVVAPPASAASR